MIVLCPKARLISIHAPLAGRDLRVVKGYNMTYKFQSTRPLRGATVVALPLAGSWRFQSTRPLRGATLMAPVENVVETNFNPRAPCGARRRLYPRGPVAVSISIHAPLAGRDLMRIRIDRITDHFNPRAPCGARRQSGRPLRTWTTFQSTRPLRGATMSLCCHCHIALFQSTRPLRGATVGASQTFCGAMISIHAPLAGRDIEDSINHRFRLVFQSTRPLRGATEDILAHATHLPEFQSTRPLRGATFAPNASPTAARFQSTRPLRGATWPSRTRWEPA